MNVSCHFDTWGAARLTHGSLSSAWGVALALVVVVGALFSTGLKRGLLMHRIAHRAPALLIVGLVLLAYSTLALAQQNHPPYGPDWSIIATAAIGVVTLLVGAYAKGLDGRVSRAELQISELNKLLLRDYHSKSDSERTLRDGIAVVRVELVALNNLVTSMHGELQRIRTPHA